MPHHDTSLIATIAAGLGVAFLFGLIISRLRLPLILAYLMAGIAIGPYSPGFVADKDVAQQLSEIGVSLLMFGVGLHFSIKDLLAVRRIAVPGAIAQIAAATLMGAILVRFWGWSWGAGIVFGLCLSVASTVVLLRALTERRAIESMDGRIAVGWLIVEDLVTVLALVMLPALSLSLGGKAPPGSGPNDSVLATLGLTVLKVGIFAVVMFLVGKKVIPQILGRVARTGSRELFTLGVLAISLGTAFGAAYLFGISPALGAFFAGVIISESDLSYQAGAEMLPLQEAFTVLFFVSVGMLFDPSVLLNQPLQVLLVLAIVMVGKSLAALFIVLLFRYPLHTALTISASLAQIGEFSFILLGLGISLALIPSEAQSIVVGASILSIALNPLIFRTVDPIDQFVKARHKLAALLERRRPKETETVIDQYTGLINHVVLVGYGRVGSTIARALRKYGIPFVVIDLDRLIIDLLKEQGERTVYGDAARPGILSSAGIIRARLLIVATPSKSQAREIVKVARKKKPDIRVCVRTHSWADAIYYEELGIEEVVMGELELALRMAHVALESCNRTADQVDDTIEELRSLGPRALARPIDELAEEEPVPSQ